MDVLDHATCYQAISRRDARFDGRFYTAVRTTGIFCRPSCPARTPKSSNVEFYPHAATASEAGYRPCRRCRPELAPGHPEWNRRADLTGKALKLIEAGAVDRGGVTGLAGELGVSERHLRRELNETLGTGPLQLARARRLWLARLLLDQTSLSITDIAFASGFGSLRQFNDSIRQAFDAAPSDLRRRVGGSSAARTITLQLPCRGDLRWEPLRAFLAMRAIPGLEVATTAGFRRNVPGGWIELGQPGADDGNALTMTCSLDHVSDLADVLPMVRTVADLDADLDPIEQHLGADPELARRLAISPLQRLPGTFDRFELAVRAIVGQQVSVAAARTLLGRLMVLASPVSAEVEPVEAAVGDAAETAVDEAAVVGETGHGLLYPRFPSAEDVAAADLDQLGMPSRRRATIQALARAVVDRTVELSPLTEPAALTEQLLAVPGIGPWTAGYISMRALSDPDGWPVGDLALRRSLGVDADELERRCTAWQPWRAYAALLLWRTDPTVTTTQTTRRSAPSSKPDPNTGAKP